MSIIGDIKEVVSIVQKADNIELLTKVPALQGDALELVEENGNLRGLSRYRSDFIFSARFNRMPAFANRSVTHSAQYRSELASVTPYRFIWSANSATTASGENGGRRSRIASITARSPSRCVTARVRSVC
jgi:hypothetical protein